ncbi:hypothetical protein ASD50_20635 [Mesorhizobium sp. Root552]|uniref:DUF6551 family protein n=1 Tax=Mesorhizobium sp. Root552 TaxID=1736555 RepID=UPI000701B1DA|nr:DUF6551 family protein [Mesorhizobium sp. Root552]KQZ25833.1 hypothetical protein ASD50_20635 [Mesorhizobium sp. Root552]
MTEELPDPGEVPALDWIDKNLITVDPLYQRPLDAERAKTIARAFSWRSFGALVVVPAGDGYHVTDGQHRLEAAKVHPKVTHVPAVIVQVETIQSEAGMFVDINRNRKNVSALELFFAELAAETGGATEVLQAAKSAGMRIPKYPGNFKPNDTIAVSALHALVATYAPERVQTILETVAAGKFRPVSANQIKAVEHLLTDREFSQQIIHEDLATLLGTVGTSLDGEAKRFAATHGTPFWKALASTWFQKCRKRRSPAKPGLQENPRSIGLPKNPIQNPAPVMPARTIVPHTMPTQRNVTASVCGDPPAGRSALDQRKATA